MNLNSSRPLGDQTTVIDIADRDDMDDDMFPLDATQSWFTRTKERRYLPFTPVVQEFIFKGSAEFGGKFLFELGSVNAGDLLFSVAFQIQLGHWLPDTILQGIQSGQLVYKNPNDAWFWANSLGTSLISKAEFQLEDQVLESVDGDFANITNLLFSDINTQFGIGIDAYGRSTIPELLAWDPSRSFPTTNQYITCILPFSFQRIRLRNGFPLLSCKEGNVRVAITLRPFSECIRSASGLRTTCDETPLGKTIDFIRISDGSTITVQVGSVIPQPQNVRLVTYGMMTDGKLRKALIHAPFERMYREVQTFRFDEPKKYVVNTPSSGIVRLQLPLEINGPIEELLWIIRRKAVNVNNEWTNYSSTLESEYNTIFRPLQSMLVGAVLQVNGAPLIEAEGDYFRRHISKAHRGGLVAYNNFIYGYTFAEQPGRHNPTGWMNSSRSTDVRLRLDIRPPKGSEDLEFEVLVYSIAINWIRFEGGIANRLFSS